MIPFAHSQHRAYGSQISVCRAVRSVVARRLNATARVQARVQELDLLSAGAEPRENLLLVLPDRPVRGPNAGPLANGHARNPLDVLLSDGPGPIPQQPAPPPAPLPPADPFQSRIARQVRCSAVLSFLFAECLVDAAVWFAGSVRSRAQCNTLAARLQHNMFSLRIWMLAVYASIACCGQQSLEHAHA